MNEPLIVEAIDDGKIIRVSEEYAKREGLPILRRPTLSSARAIAPSQQPIENREKVRKNLLAFDEYRKPLRQTKNNVAADLVLNFHWVLQQKRRQRNLSRRQVAGAIQVSEKDIKLIENGIIPNDDYVLISKLESYYGISLRKQNAPASMRALTKPIDVKQESSSQINKNEIDSKNEEIEIFGSDIELEK